MKRRCPTGTGVYLEPRRGERAARNDGKAESTLLRNDKKMEMPHLPEKTLPGNFLSVSLVFVWQ